MPRNAAATIENNFINGLVTEATALNFPEAAASETLNCEFLPKGNVSRRYGMNFEPSYQLNTIDRTGVVVTTFLWQNAAGNGDNNFVVLQVGSTLTFYKVGENPLSASSSGTINLTTFSPSGAPSPSLAECQFAFGKGYLFVTHKSLEPFFVEYSVGAGTFSATQISIKIRDFDGIEEAVTIDNRPATLTDTHKYNLYNQGWEPFSTGGLNDMTITSGQTVNIAYPTSYAAGNPLTTWDANRTDIPSNGDVWWLFKDASEVFQPKLANAQLRGNSPAPKGHYLMDAFHIDRSTVSGITGFTIESAGTQRPKAVAFFAGRVWYAGVDAQGFSNKIYFSQLVRNTAKDFGKCYQQNDPTSEFSFDLLPTDGGAVQILDCGEIIKLVVMQNSLVVFASNGVFGISGSQGVGFSANDYSVKKISSIPTLSASSFVDVAGTPAWWNTDGIYTIGGNDTLGQIQVTSLTEKKIKTFFNLIPAANKAFVKGYYNNLTKVVQWCYRSTEAVSLTENYEFDTIMNLNTVTGAFYPWQVTGDVKLNSIVALQGNAAEVVGGVVTIQSIASSFKYLVSFPVVGSHKLTFAEVFDVDYKDFFSFDSAGVDAAAYLVSGFKIHGDGQRMFQNNYLYIYCDNEEPAKFHLQALWDFATNSDTGDFGSKQLISWSPQSRSYRIKRLKIRGMGQSLQFKLTSIATEPFNVVGWSAFETGNASI